jgi:hypothetical protein
MKLSRMFETFTPTWGNTDHRSVIAATASPITHDTTQQRAGYIVWRLGYFELSMQGHRQWDCKKHDLLSSSASCRQARSGTVGLKTTTSDISARHAI